MSDEHRIAALTAARDRAEDDLRRARAEAEWLRDSLMRSDERLTAYSQEVAGVRSQLICSGYLQSSTGDVSDALTRALSDGEPVRTARYRGDEPPSLNHRPTPDLHRVTPLLGEPGLLIRSDRFTLLSEADGRTALAIIEVKAGDGTLWEVRPPMKIDSVRARLVTGWAEAMTAAVELAALVRVFYERSSATWDATNALHAWSRTETAASPD